METPTIYQSFTTHSANSLRKQLVEFEPQDLEDGLVRKFLTVTRQNVVHNTLLRGILNPRGEKKKTAALIDTALADVSVTSIPDLVKAFELLVPSPDNGGGPGSVFTPEGIADFMAQQVITSKRKDARVVDPACGCGALLIAALKQLYKVNRGKVLPSTIIENQLFGSDIDADGVRRVTILFSVQSLLLGEDIAKIGHNIKKFDSLNIANWKGNIAPGSFDVVIANPPYVRFHELSENDRSSIAARWSSLSHGNFNLYYPFFELADALRAPGGGVSFITPNAYFRAASAAPLRKWMVSTEFPTRIIDFGENQIFSDAVTYTAITISEAKKSDLQYVQSDGVDSLASLKDDDFSNFSVAALGDKSWSLVGKAHQKRISKLHTGGRGLLEVADICYGVATLRDKIYLLSGATRSGKFVKDYEGESFSIEASATRQVLRIPDLPNQEALDTSRTRILFPYDTTGTKTRVWDEDELIAHPGAHEYLKAVAPELAKRDHGKKTYAAWYGYGRTQGLSVSKGGRLLTPLYAGRPRFLTDDKPKRLFLNGCAVTPIAGSGVSLELLSAILNSGLLHYFIEQTSSPISGGFFAYQKGPLSKFRIPDGVITRERDVLASSGSERNKLLASIYGVTLPKEYI